MPTAAPKLDAHDTVRLFHKIVECSHGQEMDIVLNMIQEKQIPVAALKKLNKLDEYIEVEAIDKNHKAETVNYLTPLGFATKMGFQKKVKELLDAGANPNLKEAYGMQYTPLQRAMADGNKSLVKIIMKANPNVNVVDQRGDTPLVIAINQDDLALVKMLIKAGAQVNKDLQGHNALVIAVDRYCDTTEDDGSIEIIKELLKAGAELKDASGFDVVEFAKAEGVDSLVRVRRDVVLDAAEAAELRLLNDEEDHTPHHQDHALEYVVVGHRAKPAKQATHKHDDTGADHGSVARHARTRPLPAAGVGSNLDSDGGELGNEVGEDRQLKADERYDAKGMRHSRRGGRGRIAVVDELGDGEVAPRLAERVHARRKHHEGSIQCDASWDPTDSHVAKGVCFECDSRDGVARVKRRCHREKERDPVHALPCAEVGLRARVDLAASDGEGADLYGAGVGVHPIGGEPDHDHACNVKRQDGVDGCVAGFARQSHSLRQSARSKHAHSSTLHVPRCTPSATTMAFWSLPVLSTTASTLSIVVVALLSLVLPARQPARQQTHADTAARHKIAHRDLRGRRMVWLRLRMHHDEGCLGSMQSIKHPCESLSYSMEHAGADSMAQNLVGPYGAIPSSSSKGLFSAEASCFHTPGTRVGSAASRSSQ